MSDPMEGNKKYSAASIATMVESGMFSAADSSESSEEDYFDLSDPEATAEGNCNSCHKLHIKLLLIYTVFVSTLLF